ncbi:MAG: Holliday junction resolvase RuvX, partial [Patescibacteria group bacterium]
MKLIGIDYGDSKVGLAIGDIESGVATPYGIIRNLGLNNVIGEIKKICDRERISKIIIGIPINPMALESE